MSYVRRDTFNPVRSCNRCGHHFGVGELIHERVAEPGDPDDSRITGVVLCIDCARLDMMQSSYPPRARRT